MKSVFSMALRQGLRGVAVLAIGIGLAGPTLATLVNPVSVTMFAPGGYTGDPGDGFTLVDLVNPAVGIVVGDGSNIGSNPTSIGGAPGFMLPGEFIRFVDNSIQVHVAAGATNGTNGITGVFGDGTDHARYEFDDLAITGKVITGIAVYGFDGFGTTGTSGLLTGLDASSFVDFDGTDMVTLLLDDLIFAARTAGESGDYAEFRIDLLTRDVVEPPAPVPEPASAALVLAALIGLRFSRRAKHRAH